MASSTQTKRKKETCEKRMMDTPKEPQRCYRCGRMLIPEKTLWLELNSHTGVFHVEGFVPPSQSQGCFAFGTCCEAKVIGKKIPFHM